MRKATEQSWSPRPSISRRRFLQATAGFGVVATIGTATTGATQDGTDVLWAFTKSSDAVASSPTVVNGSVYVGWEGGTLEAFDADTGDREWAYGIGRDDSVMSTPSVDDGIVYVGAQDRRLHAIDADTGQEEWTFNASNAVLQSPTAVDGMVFLATGENLHAIDAETGEGEWVFDEPSDTVESATVVDGVVYVGSDDGTLYAVNATTGEPEWAFTEPSNELSSATIAGEMAYFGADTEALYAVDINDGEAEWTVPISEESGRIYNAGPTVADGIVYFGVSEGIYSEALYAVEADSGEEVWSVTGMAGNAFSSPTLVDGELYQIVGERVFALDAATGIEVWGLEVAGGSFSSPTVVDGVVYVGDWDGTLYAITPGVDGSSDDSRVLLGTDGHHDDRSERVSRFGAVHFEVEIVSTNAPIGAGQELTVEIKTTNRGFERGEQPVEIAGGGFDIDTQTVTLDGGDSITNTIFWDSTEADVGEHEITVASPVDEASITVVVDDPTSNDGNGDEPDDEDDEEDGPRDDAEVDDNTSEESADEQPGFGIASGFAALGGAGALIRRRYSG